VLGGGAVAKLEAGEDSSIVAGAKLTSEDVLCAVGDDKTVAVTSDDSLLLRQLPASSTNGVLNVTPTPAHIDVNFANVTF
jgi:hypothetical protein